MKVAILTANLGNFDTPVDPVPQDWNRSDIAFHRFTDENFPPIAGLTPRLQYRIPKLLGWQMFPDYDAYIWLDGTFSFTREDCVKWFVEQLGDKDAAFFMHPHRNTIKEEVDHIEEKLQQNHPYMITRYKNGLHKEQLEDTHRDPSFVDNILLTSTAFIYRNNVDTEMFFKMWWYYQSRYYTCDQVSLPYAVHRSKIDINIIRENQYKIPYLTEVSKHK